MARLAEIDRIEGKEPVPAPFEHSAGFENQGTFRSSIFRTKLGLIAYSCSEVAPCPLLQPKSASLFSL